MSLSIRFPLLLLLVAMLPAMPVLAGPPETPASGPEGWTLGRAVWDPAGTRMAAVLWRHPAGPAAVETARTLDELAAAVDGDLWLHEPAADPPWRPLADSPATDYNPVWSPDGDALLFVSTRGGRAALYLADLAAGETWQLTDPGLDSIPVPVSGTAAWIGDELVFPRSGGDGLVRLDLATLRAGATGVEARTRPVPEQALAIPAARGDQGRGTIYETRDSGPFDLPADWLDVLGEMVPYDLDPATDALEDYSGWYGTAWEEDHASDDHAGTDFAMPTGTEVLASARGVVVEIVDGVPVEEPDAANYVVLAHGTPGEWRSTYWHLSPDIADHIEEGQEVERGDVIALSNHTGDSWAPHLHFGTYHWGQAGCPFHEGWWWKGMTFFQGVFQHADAPVYDDTADGAEVVGEQLGGVAYNGTETVKSGHYRYWRPMDWGTVVQALDHRDGLAHVDDYTETGSWTSANRGALAEHVIGDSCRVTEDGGASATFVPRVGTETDYEVRVAFGRSANARAVTYEIVHAGGSDEVILDQHGGGAGTEESPRAVTASPYSDHDDVTRSSSYLLAHYDCEDAPEQSGAEVIYRLDTAETGDISAILLPDDGVDLDIFLLDKLDDSGCVAWGDMAAAAVDVEPGTTWIVVDTRTDGTVAPAPGAYQLLVTYTADPVGDSAGEPGAADRWISLGTFPFAPGKDPAQGAITLRLGDDLEPVVHGPGRAVADAVWLHNPARDFYAFGEGEEGSAVAEDILILKEYASLGITSAASWPVRTAPAEDAPVLFRARRGQRFLSDTNFGGWYEIHAPEMGYEVGFLHEDGCFVYNRLVEDPIPEGDDDDTADPPPGDDDGCECGSANGEARPITASLGLLLVWWLRRRREPAFTPSSASGPASRTSPSRRIGGR
jgi:MYXO-CTERM domain-containing protein